MTDSAQSLLMRDTLQTDERSPFSQQSDQSFEYEFSASPALLTHVSNNWEIGAVGITHSDGETLPNDNPLAEEVTSAVAAAERASSDPSDQNALLAYDSLLAKCDHIGKWCDQQWPVGHAGGVL